MTLLVRIFSDGFARIYPRKQLLTLALDGKLLLLFGESATFAGCTFEMIFAWLPYMSKGGQSIFDVCSRCGRVMADNIAYGKIRKNLLI